MASEGDNGAAIWLLLDGEVSLVRQQMGELSFLPGGLVASIEPDESWSSYRLSLLDVRPKSRGGFDGEELLRLALGPRAGTPVFGESSKSYVAVLMEDGSAQVHSLADPAVMTASAGSAFEDVLEIATVPDGRRIFALGAAGDDGFWLHDVDANLSVRRTVVLELPAGVDEIFGLRVEPEGDRVALQSTRGDVFVYNAATGGAPVVAIPAEREPSPAGFADGRLRIAVRDDEGIAVLDLDTGTTIARYQGPIPDRPWLSPDGAILAVAEARRVSAARIGADERLRFLFEAPASVERHPVHDGSWLLAGTGETLCMATADRLWRADLDTGAIAEEPVAESRAIITLMESDGGFCFGVTGSWAVSVLGPGGMVDESELRLASELDFQNSILGLAPFAGGTRLLTRFNQAPYLKLLRLEQRAPELLARAHAAASECIAPEKRAALGLDPAPPSRCVEGGRWPYDTPEWRAWLSARLNDPAAPLPPSPGEGTPR